MIKDNIIELIKKYSDEGDFAGPAEDDKIYAIEQWLGVKFPESYKWFLANYGAGGICGVSISGCENVSTSSVVLNTERYRKLGLEGFYVVVEDYGDLVYCLDTSNFDEEECPIVSWKRNSVEKNKRYDTFYDYLLDTFNEAIDNWDEDDE